MLRGMLPHRLRRVAGRRKAVPVVGDHREYWEDFQGSRDYWERRYAKGGDSGPGSYDALAGFKAQTLNEFVSENQVASVLELGCGDGNQLRLADYPRYAGLDVATGAIDRCQELFAGDPTKSFFLYDPRRFTDNAGIFSADLAMSLDVIFHLVEDEVFLGHLRLLFTSARRFACIYSSNEEIADDWPHVRHRRFTDAVAEGHPDWELWKTVNNPHKDDGREGAVADFYFYRKRS